MTKLNWGGGKKPYRHPQLKDCPMDTNGDGNCGQPGCPICGLQPQVLGPPEPLPDLTKLLPWGW